MKILRFSNVNLAIKVLAKKDSMKTVHEHIKAFLCEYCFKCFGHKHDLKRHVLIVHESNKEFECKHCGKSFGQKVELVRHIKVIHKAVKF